MSYSSLIVLHWVLLKRASKLKRLHGMGMCVHIASVMQLEFMCVFFFRENRYLLLLTENYVALQVIKHFLPFFNQKKDEVSLSSSSASMIGSARGLEESPMSPGSTFSTGHRIEPYVLFGSSFPKDREYTQVCRNINQIKICMETGRTVILLNLENLYESLYDLLNQYYIILAGGQRYVDLGLQTHRVKCRVHNDFK